MSVVELDVYDSDAPNGAALGQLTDEDLVAFEVRVARDELGSGKIVIPRTHAKAALLVPGRLVKVTYPAIDPDPVWAFWLTVPNVVVLSETEQENMTIGGFGPLWGIKQARLLNTAHAPGQADENTEPNQIDEANGQWFWDFILAADGIGYISILVRGLEEGQNQDGQPLQHYTWDFTRLHDSNSVPVAELTETFAVPMGIDIYELSTRLRDTGTFTVVCDPNLLVQAFQTWGTNRSSATFAAGKVRITIGNILTGVESFMAANESSAPKLAGQGFTGGLGTPTDPLAPTHVLVAGADRIYRQVESPDYVAGRPGRWEFLPHDETADTAALDAWGLEYLTRYKDQEAALDVEITPGDDDLTGLYLPWKHFREGDLITIHTGTDIGDYNNAVVELTGFRVTLAEATDDATDEQQERSLHVVLEINQRPLSSGGGEPRMFAHGPVNPILTDSFAEGHDNQSVPIETRVAPEDVDPYLLVFAGSNQLQALSVEWDSDGFGSGGPDEDFTFLDRQGGTDHHVEAWELVGPTPTSDVDSAVRVNAGDGRFAHAVLYFKGIGSSPSKTIAKASGTGTNPSVSVATTVGQLVYAALSYHDHSSGQFATPITPGDDQTTITSARSGGTHSAGIHVTEQVADGSTTTAEWTLGVSQQWTAMVIVLNDTAAGGVTSAPDTPTGSPGTSSHPAHEDHSHPAPNAGLVSLVDTDDNFTGSTVEAALEELAELTAAEVIFRPSDYGAAVDGATDDSTAFTDVLLDAVAALPGRAVVELDEGTMVIDPTAMTPFDSTASGLTIRGKGRASIIKWKAGTYNLTDEGLLNFEGTAGAKITDITLEDFDLDGNRANVTNTGNQFAHEGAHFNHATHPVIRDVHARHLHGDAFDFDNTLGHRVIRCIAEDIGGSGFHTSTGSSHGLFASCMAIDCGFDNDRSGFDVWHDSGGNTTWYRCAALECRIGWTLDEDDNTILDSEAIDSSVAALDDNGANNDTTGLTIGGGLFSDLSDVTITSPQTGEMPRWNGTVWVNDAGFICVDPGAIVVDDGTPFGVTLTSVWGIDADDDTPYYDDTNVAAGEEAALFYDPLTDNYVLIAYDFAEA